jgi:hypothetical protein
MVIALLIVVAVVAIVVITMHLEHTLERLLRQGERQLCLLERLLELLEPSPLPPSPTAFAINQIVSPGDLTMSTGPVTPQILGITLGNVGTFNTLVTAPAGASFPTGTTFAWTTSDPLTTLTPSTDTTQVAVATTTSDTSPLFTLTCVATMPGGATLTATASVPLNAPVVTSPPTPTAFAINQLS